LKGKERKWRLKNKEEDLKQNVERQKRNLVKYKEGGGNKEFEEQEEG
jgi:hypothetical protein